MTTSFLVTSGTDPDLDGLACSFAYAEIMRLDGKAADVAFEGSAQLDAEFMLKHFNVPLPLLLPDTCYSAIILLDMSSIQYAPAIARNNPELVRTVFDHRSTHQAHSDFPNAQEIRIEPVGACATLITERAMHKPGSLSRFSATTLYGAIASNTLDLKASLTTDRDRDAVAYLSQHYGIEKDLITEMHRYRSDFSAERLVYALTTDFDPHFITSAGSFGIAQIEVLSALPILKEFGGLICATLSSLQQQFSLDHVFLNVPSITDDVTFLLANDASTRDLLSHCLHDCLQETCWHLDTGVTVLATTKLLLRKQIKAFIADACFSGDHKRIGT